MESIPANKSGRKHLHIDISSKYFVTQKGSQSQTSKSLLSNFLSPKCQSDLKLPGLNQTTQPTKSEPTNPKVKPMSQTKFPKVKCLHWLLEENAFDKKNEALNLFYEIVKIRSGKAKGNEQ